MKKVSISITVAPEVYAKMVSAIQDGTHHSENELIDAAMRQYLEVPVPELPDPEHSAGTSEENE